MTAVVPIEIGDDSDPWQKFAFRGSFPSIHVYIGAGSKKNGHRACGKNLSVGIRVTKKDVSTGGNLSMAKQRKKDREGTYCANLTHAILLECRFILWMLWKSGLDAKSSTLV